MEFVFNYFLWNYLLEFHTYFWNCFRDLMKYSNIFNIQYNLLRIRRNFQKSLLIRCSHNVKNMSSKFYRPIFIHMHIRRDIHEYDSYIQIWIILWIKNNIITYYSARKNNFKIIKKITNILFRNYYKLEIFYKPKRN